MTDTTASLLRVVAGLLSAAGVGSYAEGSVPNPALPVITFKKLPLKPDRAITLNAVVLNESADGTVRLMLQVRCRGAVNAPLDVDTIADACYGVLNGTVALAFGSGSLSQLVRRTAIQNGQDDADRYERIDQFYADADYGGLI